MRQVLLRCLIFLPSFTCAQTLQQVTDNGAITSNPIYVGSLNISNGSGSYRDMTWRTNGILRWDLYTDPSDESGDNAGSNLQLASYSDNGGYLRSIFFANRRTGDFGFTNNVGIGTWAPTERLEVNGRLRVVDTQIWDSEINRYNNDNLFIGFRNTANTILQANGGNVGIGIAAPTEKLSVNGKIRAKEIKIEANNWPDYVFDESYRMRTLDDLEEFVKANKHLPDMPTEAEVKREGIELGVMNAMLLRKIEELTLYVIELKKENRNIRNELKTLKK